MLKEWKRNWNVLNKNNKPSKFDGTYFHVWKHQVTLILKVETLINVA